MRLTLSALICLPLIACQTVPDDGYLVAVPPQGQGCGAADLQGLVGQPLDALPAQGAWHTLRVIHPGMMVTMDYSDSRLNARVDGQDTILDLSCG